MPTQQKTPHFATASKPNRLQAKPCWAWVDLFTWVGLFALVVMVCPAKPAAAQHFGIQVVDADTGRGIPLVELRTTYKQRYFTDSNGFVAFYEPELMNQNIWFHVDSWGYESPTGPYGVRGVQLNTKSGSIAKVEIKRNNIAERLYRTTGYGIYRDSLMLRQRSPMGRQPLVNGKVAGSDTVQTAFYKGRMRWFWQDTDQFAFPLGNFKMTGATSLPPARLDPDKGIDFTYFVREPNGFAKEMTRVKEERALPVWCDGFMVVWDARNQERMVCRYSAVDGNMNPVHAGLMVYKDDQDVFVELKRFPNLGKSKLIPTGHPIRVNVDGQEYYYISHPLPNVRVKATFEDVTNFDAYEGLTCFKPNTSDQINRDRNGKLLWTWQRGAEPVTPKDVDRLVRDGLIQREESLYDLKDVATGNRIGVASGSLAWNPHLKKWTYLFGQSMGKSMLGEIWFATANAPEGPWVQCQQVATHARHGQNMDFYNPMQHPELMQDGGRFVYFEGTFVNTFSGTSTPVPYYDYNQLMYRLDLNDPRLKQPEPPAGLSNAKPSTVFVWGK